MRSTGLASGESGRSGKVLVAPPYSDGDPLQDALTGANFAVSGGNAIAFLIRTSRCAGGFCLGFLFIPYLCAFRAELHNPRRARYPPCRFRPSRTVTKLRRLCRIVRKKYHRVALLYFSQSSSFRSSVESKDLLPHTHALFAKRKIRSHHLWGRGSGKHSSSSVKGAGRKKVNAGSFANAEAL